MYGNVYVLVVLFVTLCSKRPSKLDKFTASLARG